MFHMKQFGKVKAFFQEVVRVPNLSVLAIAEET